MKIVPCALSGSQLTSFFFLTNRGGGGGGGGGGGKGGGRVRGGGGGGGGGGRERNEEGSIKGSGVGNRKSIVPLPLKGMRIILCIV